jgi:hypothetical protein
MSDKHESIASSQYSGNTNSAETVTTQTVKKIEGEAMTASAEAAQKKRRENVAARRKREAAEMAEQKQ